MAAALGAAAAPVVGVVLPASSARAQQLSIGAGSSFSLSKATLDLGCSDLVVAGVLHAGGASVARAADVTIAGSGILNGGSATLSVTGDWTRSGSFDPGAGSVSFVDGCGRTASTVAGDTGFHDLALASSTGKQVLFTAGETTSVAGTFTADGASGSPLAIASTVDGSQAYLDLAQPGSGSYVDVRDNHAIGETVSLSNSVSSGNSPGWVDVVAVPALALLGLGVLVACLSLSGTRSLRRTATTRAGAQTSGG